MITKLFMSVRTERDPRDVVLGARPCLQNARRGFVVPDAAMPGPLGRLHPEEIDSDDGSAGGDSTEDHDASNQDRI